MSDLLTLEELAALPEDGKGPCLYFLWRGAELLYIGGTGDYHQRIERHWRNQKYAGAGGVPIPFDRSTRLDCPKGWLWELEEKYLIKYEPPYCVDYTRKRSG